MAAKVWGRRNAQNLGGIIWGRRRFVPEYGNSFDCFFLYFLIIEVMPSRMSRMTISVVADYE